MNALLRAFATGADREPLGDAARVDALYRRHRLRVMIAITLGYGLVYTCRLALSVVKKPLIDAGIFSPTDLGLIGSALFYTYAVGKLVNGFLADHANMKVFFAFAVLVSALLNIGMGFSTMVAVSALLWGLNGWFQSFGAPAGVVAMTNWFSNRERGRFYGIWSTAHSIGEGLTFVAVGGVVAAFGWRYGFWGPGVLCVLVAIAMFWLVQDRPRTLGLPTVADWRNDHWKKAPPTSTADAGVFRTQLSILGIPAVWVLALASASIYVSRYAINSWGVLYLQEVHGFSLVEAGSFLMANTFAGILGCLAFGFISDKWFNARRPPANLLFALAEIAGLALLFYGPNTTASLISAFVLYGLGLNGLVTSLGGLFAVDIAPKRVAGAAMGLIGIFSYVGAAIQENVSGHLIERGMTIAADGVRHYDFGPATWFWLGSSIVSMLLAATLWRVRLRD
ncbi:MAG: Membrane sensor protein UhpC [Steroidobacteraceae bacterium]|nr:Membrane sensor protein UhpC [Steroidobacteraceae bacterium]